MGEDEQGGQDRKAPAPEQAHLSDETAEDAKRSILFGVGYKRPPERTRFKKGQPGNPKGRPRTSDLGMGGGRSADALVLREAARPVTIREGGETRQISAIEAVLRSQYVSATRGSAFSQKHIIERYDRAEREERNRIRDENQLWEGYIARCREEIAEARRRGEALPAPLPHPDDVVIDEEKGVRFIGPIDQEQAARLEETCKLRDVLILQDALDRREADTPDSGDPLDQPGTALMFAHLLNTCVPARHRLSDIEITLRMMRHGAIPKRELLKTLLSAWRELGVKTRRGRRFPPLRYGKQVVDQIGELLDGI